MQHMPINYEGLSITDHNNARVPQPFSCSCRTHRLTVLTTDKQRAIGLAALQLSIRMNLLHVYTNNPIKSKEIKLHSDYAYKRVKERLLQTGPRKHKLNPEHPEAPYSRRPVRA